MYRAVLKEPTNGSEALLLEVAASRPRIAGAGDDGVRMFCAGGQVGAAHAAAADEADVNAAARAGLGPGGRLRSDSKVGGGKPDGGDGGDLFRKGATRVSELSRFMRETLATD